MSLARSLSLGGALFVSAVVVQTVAAPSPDFKLRDEPAVFGGTSSPTDPAAAPRSTDEPATANPLWGIPLASLTATRDRPLFLPTRRAPAPAVPSVTPTQVKPIAAPAPAAPEKPEFSLVGVIAGAADGIAIFTDDTSRDVFRLRTGEAYNGWILRSVRGREAVLEKNQQNAILEIPSPGGSSR